MCVPTLLRGVLRVASSLLVAVVLVASLTACETSLSARIPGSPEAVALASVANEALPSDVPTEAGRTEDGWGEPPAGTGLEPTPSPEDLPAAVPPTEALPAETLPAETLPGDLGTAPLEDTAPERPGSTPLEEGPLGAGPRAVGPRPATPRAPPPPFWDPSRDRKVHVGPDGRPVEVPGAQPATTEPAAPEPVAPESPAEVPSPEVAEVPYGVPPAGRRPVETPPAGTQEPALPSPRAGSADDWGTPPGGTSRDPFPAVPPTRPLPAQNPPTQNPPTPAPARAEDPWLPGGGPSGATEPAPAETPPSKTTPAPANPAAETPGRGAGELNDPWLPGAGPGGVGPRGTEPARAGEGAPAPRAEDPWLPGTGGAPKTDPAPADGPQDPWSKGPDAPASPRPATPRGEAAGGNYVGATAAARAMEQVTRLTDQPGSANVLGYPDDLLRSCDAGMVLTSGRRPAVVVFYDDTSRASDLQAARLLPLLVRYGERIDFISIDRGADAQRSGGAEVLAKKYLDHVPTVVLLDADRQTRFYRSGLFEADALERALDQVLDAPAAGEVREPSVPDPGRADPRSPLDGPPAGLMPPAGPLDRPLPGEIPSAERPGMAFTPPAGYSAKAHALRLRSAPGDAAVPGYPTEILTSAPPERVLASSVKPAVIIFFDDSSKASDLQAAAFLPLLVERQRDVELVLIDVGTRSQWNAAQKKVVRTYYNFYVPTTVVLAPNRAPIKSWYSRSEAADLARAIDQALGR